MMNETGLLVPVSFTGTCIIMRQILCVPDSHLTRSRMRGIRLPGLYLFADLFVICNEGNVIIVGGLNCVQYVEVTEAHEKWRGQYCSSK